MENEEIKINTIKFKQKDKEFYLGILTAGQVARMFDIAPNTRENPDGVQRLLKKRKVDDIEKYSKGQKGYLPTTGVLNVEKDVKIKKTKNSNVVEITFPKVSKIALEESESGAKDAYGYLIDHQHTLKGVLQSGQEDFLLPWVILNKCNKKTAWKLFADINSYQTPVNKVTLDRLRYKLWELSTSDVNENQIVEILDSLNEDEESVLKGKIRGYQDDKNTWINLPAFKKFLKFPFAEFERLDLKLPEIESILKNFYSALSKIYPTAWGDNGRKNFVLCKSMGFYITAIAILPTAFRRCYTKYGLGNWTEENFIKEIKGKIKKIKLSFVDGDREVELDWSSNEFGQLSNEKGIQAIIKAIRKVYKER